MTPSHAVKNGRRYRYYITHASELRPGAPQAWRMPAQDVEVAVIDRLVAYFRDYREIATLAGVGSAAATIAALVQRASDAAQRLGDPVRRGAVVAKLVKSITMAREEIRIEVDRIAVARMLEISRPEEPNPILLSASATKVREGKATKLVLAESGRAAPERDPKLVALLAEARSARDLILASPDRSIREIAADQQRCRHRIAKLIRLSWLSPEIATAIVEGRQPKPLTAKKLLDIDWPLDWNAQALLISQYIYDQSSRVGF